MSEARDRNGLMQSIQDVSAKMLDQARLQNWDEVCDLERQRSTLLSNFAQCKDVLSQKQLIEQLQQTIKINEEIQFLSKQEMNACLQKCVSMKRGKKAFSAYANLK